MISHNYYQEQLRNAENNIAKAKDFSEAMVLLKTTLPLLFPELDVSMIENHLSYLKHLLTHKGVEYTLRYLKATHESIESLVLDSQDNLEHEKVSLGKDTDGWPNWLGDRLKSNCQTGQLHSIRYCLTLCSARRLLTVPTKTNLKSITDAPTWEEKVVLRDLLNNLRGRDRDLMRLVRKPTLGSDTTDSQTMTTHKVPRLCISLKSSPNGISFFAFPWDRAAIIVHDLTEKLTAFAETFYEGDSDDWVQDHLEPYEELVDSNRQLNVGKISLIHETGKLKPRVFAIVDSVTQSLLSEFHDFLMSVLKKIPEDCTFDQNKVSRVAKEQALGKQPFYGFADLSSASDRLPAYLYEEIGNHLSPGLGTAWVALFDRPFILGNSVIENWDSRTKMPKHVRYQCGQPMGALSSWPFMALVHHVLVWYSFGSRKASLGKYLILGDDIVIFEEETYKQYCALLVKLGIPYTHGVSTKGFEFAKRVFVHGREITGAYTQALYASRNVPEIFTLEWRNLSNRGYDVGNDLHPTFRTLLKVSRKRYEWCRLLMTIPYGTEIPIQKLSAFAVQQMGRSFCLLSGTGNEERFVESVKAFRQAASFLIKQKFQEELNVAKAAISTNLEEFRKAFIARSGLADQFTQVMQTAIEEVSTDSNTRIRYLERDLKLQYLNPTDKQLLSPNLPDLPRRIDFSNRDRHLERLKYRAEHQRMLVQLLRG